MSDTQPTTEPLSLVLCAATMTPVAETRVDKQASVLANAECLIGASVTRASNGHFDLSRLTGFERDRDRDWAQALEDGAVRWE